MTSTFVVLIIQNRVYFYVRLHGVDACRVVKVDAQSPITESQVPVTSHWNALELSGHSKSLLNNRLDRNNW